MRPSISRIEQRPPVSPEEKDLVVMAIERGFGVMDIAAWLDGFRAGARRQLEAAEADVSAARRVPEPAEA